MDSDILKKGELFKKKLDKTIILMFGILFSVVGLAIIHHFVFGLPTFNDLVKVTGKAQITQQERAQNSSTIKYPVVIIENERYIYPDWFPDSEKFEERLAAEIGDTTIWVHGQSKQIWQLQKGNKLLYKYDDILKAIKNLSKNNIYFGIFSTLFGLVLLIYGFSRRA